MNSRHTAPLVFAALCLGLSVLVLRRQVVAHPKPKPVADVRNPYAQADAPPPGIPADPRTLHIEKGQVRRAVLDTVTSQLTAIRTGDADKAWSYQSQSLRRNFHSAKEFQSMISAQNPEFGHAKSVVCDSVWTDPARKYAGVVVTVQGDNGRRARTLYLLVWEGKGYKVASVRGGGVIK